MLKRFSAAKKLSSQNRSPKWQFFENFGEDRLRGYGAARGRILAFSIDLLRRL